MEVKKPKLNVKLLRKVQKYILEEPKRLNMFTWREKSDLAPCGTVGCIAGWACILAGEKHVRDYPVRAAKILGLNENAFDIDNRIGWVKLFLVEYWPTTYGRAYFNSQTDTRRARITSNRIDYFIKHGL